MTNALAVLLSRPRTILTLMLVMIVAGVSAYISIPKEAQPDIDVPVYIVTVTQNGIAPGDSERLLVRPLESKLRGLDGLKEITTIAAQGAATAVLEFQIDTDKDKVLADIRDKVDQAKTEMPADADEPIVNETNFALQPTIIVTLSGQVPERTLYRYARRLKDEIEAIGTVRSADLSGNREEMLEVVLDLARLESYDITQNELLTALSQNNQLVAAGFLDDGNSRFNLKVPGLVESAADVYAIPIKQNGEAVITLGEVAEIRRTFKDASSYTRVNGEPAIALQVTKRLGTNIIENNTAVREAVERFSADWPETIKINYLLDQSSFINEVQGSLMASIMTAIALVMIVVVASLGLRTGLLVGLSIPVSFMIGFLILSSVGMTVNMMVLFGMVLTVGMLVDGAIVVTEYADRKLSEGMEPEEAYTRAAQLMFWPVVSSTATTLAAFLPLLLWPGVSGEFMSYLPVMVIIVLTASLMTALIFLPTSGALTGRIAAAIGKRIPFRKKRVFGEDQVSVMYTSSKVLDIRKVPGAMGSYLTFLKYAAGNVFGNMAVIAAVIVSTITVFTLFGSNNAGVEFFVDEEPDVAIVLVSARGNLSATQIRDYVSEVEQVALNVKGIDNVVMTANAAGSGPGGPLGDVQDKPADVVGELQIELADFCCRRRAVEIFQEIRDKTAAIPGLKVEVRKIEGGPPTGKDIRLEVKSTDYNSMIAAVTKLREKFDSVTGIQDIEDGRPLPGIELELNVDREQAGRYNAGIAAVGSMVQLVSNGVMIGSYRPNDSEDELEIRVRLPKADRTFDTLDQLKLRTANGQVPLSNFVTRTAVPKVASITRKDGLYAMELKANLIEGFEENGAPISNQSKIDEIQAFLDAETWSPDIQFRFRGSDEEEKEAGEFLGKAAGISLFLMFIILVTQFNSFYQTILTLFTVVLAVVGVLIGQMVTGSKFSIIMTGTGVIALAGIVVNNAIVLIDTYNRLLSEGVEPREAVLKTSAQRLRPIMLTTITTILGLVPMALQLNVNFFERTISYGGITSVWWVQLSIAVISGLAFSTLLTLVVIPAMLSLPSNIMALFNGRGLFPALGDGTAQVPALAGAAIAADNTLTPDDVSLPKDGTVEPFNDEPERIAASSRKAQSNDNKPRLSKNDGKAFDDDGEAFPDAAE
ncbi:efflux RND transporter permease subunit [Pseudahrensia aquimaris]|uniref:Efflux RND transporter permease subunit n=1 Tax=Pseudahrensia aquimaris TaxID=744461 RepID=A0ABW3FEM9_9HYPH